MTAPEANDRAERKSGPLKLFAIHSQSGNGESEPADSWSLDDAARLLSQARSDRGLTVAAASDAVRIRPEYITALEELRIDALPGVAYAAPFARTYATYLGLDGARFAAVYGEAARAIDGDDRFIAPPTGLEAKPSRSLYAGLGVALAVVAVLGWVFLAPSPEDESAAPSVLIDGPVDRIVGPEGTDDRTDLIEAPAAQSGLGLRTEPVDVPDGRILGPGDPTVDPYLRAARAAWLRVEGPDGAVVFMGDVAIGDRFAAPAGAGYVASVRDAGAFDHFGAEGFLGPLGRDGVARAAFAFE